jgi:hypothetical protein
MVKSIYPVNPVNLSFFFKPVNPVFKSKSGAPEGAPLKQCKELTGLTG